MSVFVDTSALYALLDRADENHLAALEAFDQLLGVEDLVTHNYVHVEAEQLVRRRLGAGAARNLLEVLLPSVRTVWVDAQTHAEALRGLSTAGRSASLVDQVSFVVMRNLDINVALAFDAAFDREGYGLPQLAHSPRRHALSETPTAYGTAVQPSELVSVSELAARSGRSINTIQSWRRRHRDFPTPSVELAAGPIWLWEDVSTWIQGRQQRTGRAATQ
jgi:uncharacterized protein